MFRERILDAGRDLRVNLAPYDVVALQFSQLLGQHLFCWRRQKSLEFAESTNSALQVEQNGRLPFSTDDMGGNGNRAIERVHCGVTPDSRYQKGAYWQKRYFSLVSASRFTQEDSQTLAG
jgi:hypothetical protein